MTDKVEEIVERAIEHTRPYLDASPDRWRAARQGLQRIYDDLARHAPDHPALSRLRAFVAQRDRQAREP